MANLQIKNVPSELHEALRRRAADEGLTMSQYVIELLEQEVALPSQRQWLEQLRRGRPVSGVDGGRAVREAREEREEEIGGRLDRH